MAWGERGVCRHGEHRAAVYTIRRKTGGSYNRAAGWRPSNICEDCARGLVARITPGTLSTSNWSNSLLRSLVKRLDGEATP